jgi:hypothetical protein
MRGSYSRRFKTQEKRLGHAHLLVLECQQEKLSGEALDFGSQAARALRALYPKKRITLVRFIFFLVPKASLLPWIAVQTNCAFCLAAHIGTSSIRPFHSSYFLHWIHQDRSVYCAWSVRPPRVSPLLLGSGSKRSPSSATAEASKSEIHLRIGEVYEKSGQLDKAEAEYVIAATDGTIEIQS